MTREPGHPARHGLDGMPPNPGPSERQERSPEGAHRPAFTTTQRLVGVHGVSCCNFGLSRRASLACRATSWPDRRPEWHHRPPDQMMAVVMCSLASLGQGRQGSGAARAISGQMHRMQRDGALNSTSVLPASPWRVWSPCPLPFHVLLDLPSTSSAHRVYVSRVTAPASQRREGWGPRRTEATLIELAKCLLPLACRPGSYIPGSVASVHYICTPSSVLPLSPWVSRPDSIYKQQRPRPKSCQGRRGSTVRPLPNVRLTLTT